MGRMGRASRGGYCWARSQGLQGATLLLGESGSSWRKRVAAEAQEGCDSPGATQQTQKRLSGSFQAWNQDTWVLLLSCSQH